MDEKRNKEGLRCERKVEKKKGLLRDRYGSYYGATLEEEGRLGTLLHGLSLTETADIKYRTCMPVTAWSVEICTSTS